MLMTVIITLVVVVGVAVFMAVPAMRVNKAESMGDEDQ